MSTLAEPSNVTDPEISPDKAITLEFVSVAADPVVFALIVEGRLNVTEPVDAETSISFVVPESEVTPVFSIVTEALSPEPVTEIPAPDPLT